MPDNESRDAYVSVSVLLPNKNPITGRPVGFVAARRMIARLEDFVLGAHSQDTFDKVWEEFTRLTGVTEDMVIAACPDITLGEVIGMMQRFFYHQRTATPTSNGTHATTESAPSGR